jgi:hypothetical protein
MEVGPRSLAVVGRAARLKFAGPLPTPIRSFSKSTPLALHRHPIKDHA